MHTVISKLTSQQVLRMVGMCGCIGLLIGGTVFYATTHRVVLDDEVLLGRDFMAFYLAGHIVATGNGHALYDGPTQQAAQDAILAPETFDGLVYYINPAPVAVVYSLLARLPYRWALQIHTLAMLGAFILAMFLLRPHLRCLAPHWRLATVVSLMWMPVIQTISGGQNAALTLLLSTWAYSATVQNRQVRAGLALGLMLFKPQYALPFIGLLLLRGRWRTVAVSGVVGVGLYCLGAVGCGWDWPLHMMGSLGGLYHQQERVVSGYSHIALMEVVDFSLTLPLEQAGWATLAALSTWLGRGAVALIVVWLVWRWRDAEPSRAGFGLYWAAMSAAMILISPHAQYYEVALLVLPVLLILDAIGARGGSLGDGQRWALLASFCAYPLFEVAHTLRFQPLVILPIWITVWAARRIRAERGL